MSKTRSVFLITRPLSGACLTLQDHMTIDSATSKITLTHYEGAIEGGKIIYFMNACMEYLE